METLETLFLLKSHVLSRVDTPYDLELLGKAAPIMGPALLRAADAQSHNMAVRARWIDVIRLFHLHPCSHTLLFVLSYYCDVSGEHLAAFIDSDDSRRYTTIATETSGIFLFSRNHVLSTKKVPMVSRSRNAVFIIVAFTKFTTATRTFLILLTELEGRLFKP